MNVSDISWYLARSILVLSFLAIGACSSGGGDETPPTNEDDGTVVGEIVTTDETKNTEGEGNTGGTDGTEEGTEESTEEETIKLSVSQPLGGKVISTDSVIDCGTTCEYEFDTETSVTLNASVEEGFLFLNWEGDCSGSQLTCELVVNGSKQVGAHISATDIAGIGSQSVTRAGSTIDINYSGSTHNYDYIGIFEADATNRDYLNQGRLPDDYGTVSIRVPTVPGTYQLRMYNNQFETIVIGHDLEVLPYQGEFALQTQPLHPEDRIEVSYSGSTHNYDYLAVYRNGADGSDYSELKRLAESEGEVTLRMPGNEGAYNVLMVNNKFEPMSDSVNVTISYDASLSAQTIASVNEVFNVKFTGSTQDNDAIAIYPQNVGNSNYLDRVSLRGVTSGEVILTAPEKTGIYTIKMINGSAVTMTEHRYLSVLDENEIAVFAAPDLVAPSSNVTLAYSGTNGTETIGIFEQGADNGMPLASVSVSDKLGNASITAPVGPGYYEIRLLDQKGGTLAQFNYLKVVNPSELFAGVPQSVLAGETLSAIFSGSTGDYDYLAIYFAEETEWKNYEKIVRVKDENGRVNFRMPTIAGQYVIRLIDNQYHLLVEGNPFTVEPYNATIEVDVSEAYPKDDVIVHYTGSTDDYDYVGFVTPGSENGKYETITRLRDREGSVALTAPAVEGEYEIRMFNNAFETILVGPTVKVFYGETFVGGPQFSLPGEDIDISFNGSTNDYDYVALYKQEHTNGNESVRTRLNEMTSGTVSLTVPESTGIYSLRMVNNSNETITEGDVIAVLDPALTEVFVAPEVIHLGEDVNVAYSSAANLENATVGIYEQGASNDAPIQEQVLLDFPVGMVTMDSPSKSGIYEVRLVNANDETLSTAAYLYVIDSSTQELFIPNQVRAGETVRLGFSGSGDDYDYGASYEPGQDKNSQYENLKRLKETEGFVDFRVPTMTGNYSLRMIDQSYNTLVDGNEFTVLPYEATASFVSVAEPTGKIAVHYSGSTHPYDYIAVYALGVDNNNDDVSITRLPNREGVVSLTMPNTIGTYEIRMINDKFETMAELGSIEVSYDHSVSVSAQSIAIPGEEITVTFEGSTENYDYIALYAQESDNHHYIDLVRLNEMSEGDVQLTLPTKTGIYDIRMINSGMVTMSNNITVSVLDNTETELFIAPEVVVPGQTLTVGFSGSFASSNSACIYDQWNGAELNCKPLDPDRGNTTLVAPSVGGVFDVEMRNGSDQTLASSNLLYVLDTAETSVHGPDSVVAGDTVRFIYSGSTDKYDRIGFIPEGGSVADVLSKSLPGASGAIDVRVPTIEGNYRLVMMNNNREIIVDSATIYIEPYDGVID